jgi:hypothetical protein
MELQLAVVYKTRVLGREPQLFECEIFFARPRTSNSEVFDHVGTIDRIFGDRQELNGALAFA